MGQEVSVQKCEASRGFNMIERCTVTRADDNFTILAYGEFEKGEIPPDPDVAGIGILGIFVAVSAFALVAAALTLLLDGIDFGVKVGRGGDLDPHEDKQQRSRQPIWTQNLYRRFHSVFRDIMYSFLITCSDQQIFTGMAYAITLWYYRACEITAYHYNIISGMLLITCATHLLSVVIIRHYFRYFIPALIRFVLVGIAFIATGMVLSNQNSGDQTEDGIEDFPLEIPEPGEVDKFAFFRPAACFAVEAESVVSRTWDATFNGLEIFQARPNSTVGGYIWTWPLYLLMVLFYGFAIVKEALAWFRRGKNNKKKASKRRSLIRNLSWQVVSKHHIFLKRFRRFIHALYLLLGFGLSTTVLVSTAIYLYGLRVWAHESGWLEVDEKGKNPENEWKSFGQLVPMLVSAITVLSFLQVLNERIVAYKKLKRAHQLSTAGDRSGSDTADSPDNVDDPFAPFKQLSIQEPSAMAASTTPLEDDNAAYYADVERGESRTPRPHPQPQQTSAVNRNKGAQRDSSGSSSAVNLSNHSTHAPNLPMPSAIGSSSLFGSQAPAENRGGGTAAETPGVAPSIVTSFSATTVAGTDYFPGGAATQPPSMTNTQPLVEEGVEGPTQTQSRNRRVSGTGGSGQVARASGEVLGEGEGGPGGSESKGEADNDNGESGSGSDAVKKPEEGKKN